MRSSGSKQGHAAVVCDALNSDTEPQLKRGQRVGYTLKDASKVKATNYGVKYRPAHRPIPLAFSTCGYCSTSAQGLVKRLGVLRVETKKGLPAGRRHGWTRHPGYAERAITEETAQSHDGKGITIPHIHLR